jgi:hypothetical protein
MGLFPSCCPVSLDQGLALGMPEIRVRAQIRALRRESFPQGGPLRAGKPEAHELEY